MGGQKKGKGGQQKRLSTSPDLVWGIHPVQAALAKEPALVSEIFLQKGRHGEKIEEIVATARAHGVRVFFRDTLHLAAEDGGRIRHQGVVARIASTTLVPLADLLARLKERLASGLACRLVILDSLQDPHNLGAIIRSAYASGATAVITTRERSAPLGGVAAKTSAGAMARIDICQVTNLVSCLKELKKIGLWVFGSVADPSASSLYHTDLKMPVCIVIGNEGKGVRPLVQKECDQLVSIPMAEEIDSLNSSVAAGVILFEAMRQQLGLSTS